MLDFVAIHLRIAGKSGEVTIYSSPSPHLHHSASTTLLLNIHIKLLPPSSTAHNILILLSLLLTLIVEHALPSVSQYSSTLSTTSFLQPLLIFPCITARLFFSLSQFKPDSPSTLSFTLKPVHLDTKILIAERNLLTAIVQTPTLHPTPQSLRLHRKNDEE